MASLATLNRKVHYVGVNPPTGDYNDMVKNSSEINNISNNYVIGIFKIIGLVLLGLFLFYIYRKYNKRYKY